MYAACEHLLKANDVSGPQVSQWQLERGQRFSAIVRMSIVGFMAGVRSQMSQERSVMSSIVQKIIRSRVRLIVLALSIGIATLQHGKTTAQQIESPKPRMTLKADAKSFDQFTPEHKSSPDGKFLVSWKTTSHGSGLFGFGGGATSSNLKLWDVGTGEERLSVPDPFGGFDFSPDGKAFMVWDGKSVSIRDTTTGALVAELDHNRVHNAQFLRNGELLVTMSNTPDWKEVPGEKGTFTSEPVRSETVLKFWDTTTWAERPTKVDAAGPFYYDAAISSDGKMLAAFVADGAKSTKLKIWDIESGLEQRAPDIVAPIGYLSMMFDPDDQTLAILIGDFDAAYWDLSSSTLKTARNYIYPRHHVFELRRPFDNQPSESVELSGENIVVREWKTEELVHDFPSPARWRPAHANLFPYQNGSHLAGNRLLMLFSDESGWGATVISGGFTRKATSLEIVDLKTGNLEATLKNVVFEAASPDGELLITRDRTTWRPVLWKTRGGIELTELPTCHNPQFSPDGTLLAVAIGGTMELWEVADLLKVE